MQQVGGAFGAAVLVVILAGQGAAHAAAGPAGVTLAFGRTFWWCVGFTVLALAPALLLPGRPTPVPVPVTAGDDAAIGVRAHDLAFQRRQAFGQMS